jgi:hypothetical protein
MVIICPKLIQNIFSGLKVMRRKWNVDFLLWNEDFLTLALKCDLDLECSNAIVALYTSSDYGDHLCTVISKHFQQFLSYAADTKCILFIIKWRLFNIWPLSVTLTLVVATQLLRSAHCLIMLITCAKLFLKNFSGLKVMEQTQNVDFLLWKIYFLLWNEDLTFDF